MSPALPLAPLLALVTSLSVGQAPGALARDVSQCDLALPAGTIELRPIDVTRGFGPAEVLKAIEVRFDATGKNPLPGDKEAFLVLARCAALSKNDLLVRTSAPVDPTLFTEAVRRSGELLRLADEVFVRPDQLAIEVATRADLQPAIELRVALVGRPETAFVEADQVPAEVEPPKVEAPAPEPKTEQQLKAEAEKAVRDAEKAEKAQALAELRRAKEAKAAAEAKAKAELAAAIREEKEEREAVARLEKHTKARAAAERARKEATEKREQEENAARAAAEQQALEQARAARAERSKKAKAVRAAEEERSHQAMVAAEKKRRAEEAVRIEAQAELAKNDGTWVQPVTRSEVASVTPPEPIPEPVLVSREPPGTIIAAADKKDRVVVPAAPKVEREPLVEKLSSGPLPEPREAASQGELVSRKEPGATGARQSESDSIAKQREVPEAKQRGEAEPVAKQREAPEAKQRGEADPIARQREVPQREVIPPEAALPTRKESPYAPIKIALAEKEEVLRAKAEKSGAAERALAERNAVLAERAAALEAEEKRLAAEEKKLAAGGAQLKAIGREEKELEQQERQRRAAEKKLQAAAVALAQTEKKKADEAARLAAKAKKLLAREAAAADEKAEVDARSERLNAEEAADRTRAEKAGIVSERLDADEQAMVAREARLVALAQRLKTAADDQQLEEKLLPGAPGRQQINAAMIRCGKAIERCVEAQLKRNPVAGRTQGTLLLTIDGRGRTAAAHINDGALKGSFLEGCVQDAAKKWRFPSSGDEYELEVPLTIVGK